MMRALIRNSIVCLGVAFVCAGGALAQPKAPAPKTPAAKAPAPKKPNVRQLHAQAEKAYSDGEYEKARELADQGLAVAPKDAKLLGLKGAVLISLYDYAGALTVYKEYVKLAPAGAPRRDAQQTLELLGAVETTSLDVTLANGPADVYLDGKTQGVFCRAEPQCTKNLMPKKYQVIVERPGFEPWTDKITVEKDKVTKLAVSLVELPSQLTVRVAQAGARIKVNGVTYDGPALIAPGKYQVVVSLAGHAEAKLEAVAREGKPVTLDVSLTPVVPVRIETEGAELLLDGKPVTLQDGGLAIPPGAHVLVARAAGYQERRIEIPAVRTYGYEIEVGLTRLELTGSSQPAGPPSMFTFQRKIAIGVAGLGVASAVTGVVLGIQAGNIEDDGSLDADLKIERRELQSNLCYGAAGLAVAIAIGLWIDGTPEPGGGSSVAITPLIGPVSGLDVAVRF